ncbi:LytR C-terminal domain-containing protein [Actinacidiphila bryophytorum]|nr:LytR C-terminal domain-containing protein [Actinacidiphila bryophytorum]UWE13428.1 LytR C-terminal domain-containing protein [Actinacidiphila bryophytorum]
MSMLTPSGMGGKYRVTGDTYPRMRRPRKRGRIVAALVASVVVLGLFGWGALQLFHVFNGDDGDTKANAAPQSRPCTLTATPTPALKPMALPQPAGVTMNVYNATVRGGLAKSTADELARRGFKVKTFGNAPAPYDKKVTQSALIVAGPAAEAAAREAGTQVAGSTVKIDTTRKDKTVDLMIGTAFSSLASPADAAKARIVAANPPPAKPACTPTPAAPSRH